MEYALGLNPTLASSTGLPTTSFDSNAQIFKLEYHQASDDVDYLVESSRNLIYWSNTEVNQAYVINDRYITASVPIIIRGPVFLRLKTTLP